MTDKLDIDYDTIDVMKLTGKRLLMLILSQCIMQPALLSAQSGNVQDSLTCTQDTVFHIVNGIHSGSNYQYVQCDDVLVPKDSVDFLKILKPEDIESSVLEKRKLCGADLWIGTLRIRTKKCKIMIIVDGELKKTVNDKLGNLISESAQRKFASETLNIDVDDIATIMAIKSSDFLQQISKQTRCCL